MGKFLSISLHSLEIARTTMSDPMLVVGRAPSCDVILRAPEVQPVHFIIEWIGTGNFDPKVQKWTITDVSGDVKSGKKTGLSAQGAILTDQPLKIGDFVFQFVEDSLAPAKDVGGQIQQELMQVQPQSRVLEGSSLVEMITIHREAGTVEEVVHRRPVKNKKKIIQASVKVPQIAWEWDPVFKGKGLRLWVHKVPQAEVYKSGRKAEPSPSVEVTGQELVHIKTEKYDFFFRFIPEVLVPKVKRRIFEDELFKKIFFYVTGVSILIILLSLLWPQNPTEEVVELPRIATVEIKKVPEELEAQPPAEVMAETQESQGAGLNQEEGASAPAAAPRVASPGKVSKGGLNNNSPRGNVNRVGILGAIKSTNQQTVDSKSILNQGIATQTISGDSGEAKIVVKNPLTGVVGSQNRIKEGSSLSQASTTLSGSGAVNPQSTGPLARKGGGTGLEMGKGLGAMDSKGKGVGSGNYGLDSLGDDFVTEGGLDRETVRKIIAGTRSQIRGCYDRALFVSSNVSGKVVFQWVITTAGSVTSLKVKDSNLNSPPLQSCVNEVIQKLVFPKSGRPTAVIYPFVFQPKR